MNPKLMTAHYPGRCKKCKQRFAAGTPIYWSKSTGAFHATCMEGGNGNGKSDSDAKPKQETPKQELPPTLKSQETADEYWTVDWSELRKCLLQAMDDDFSWLRKSRNKQKARQHTLEVSDWHGLTPNQLKEWLRDGYKAEAIQNLGDFTPPIRDKRHYIYAEDGEEIFVDRVLSGEDNYMGEWSKRERIPGVAIEAEIMFSSSTDASVVNAYNAWICRAVYALESAGIDCQVTLSYSSRNAHANGPAFPHTIVRVKQENEGADFYSFSPMMSPAALRSFGFAAMTLHADRFGRDIGMGYGHGNDQRDWEVEWDNERRILKIRAPYLAPRSFPDEEMTRQLREALKQMKGNS